MESSINLLEEWVSEEIWTRHVLAEYMSGWRVELAVTDNKGYFRVAVYDRPYPKPPIVNARYHEVYLGTSESPASLDEIIVAALAKWEELHGE